MAKLKAWTKALHTKSEELWTAETSDADAAVELNLPIAMVRADWKALNEGVNPPKRAATKKTAKKKAAKKGPKVKKTVRKGPSTKPKKGEKPLTKTQRIDLVISATNSRLGADVVRRANEVSTDYLLRRPTGILSLDIGLGGGWPASAMCVLTGPDGAGKDLLINCTLAQQQRLYGDEFACLIYSTEFKFDKMFARDMCGFQVAMTKGELDRQDLARQNKGIPPLTEEEREWYSTQIGQIILVEGVVADDGLDICLDAVFANEFHMVIINSLGVMQTAAKEEKDSLREHAIQSNEAQLLARFMPHLFMLLNREDDLGRRNQTAVLATNQVRSKRDMVKGKPGMRVPERAKYQPGSGSWALKHGKAIELAIHKGSIHLDKEVKPYMLLGREIDWEVTKGKLGTHDGKRGSFDFWFDEGIDVVTDLIHTGAYYGVIEQASAWFSYQHGEDEIRGQGAPKFRTALEEHEDFEAIMDDIRSACLAEAGVVCLYT